MMFDVNGARAHALTGGPAFDPSLPVVVFLHGAGMDASVWALQTRWFAHHGYAVLALDLPAHGRSAGQGLRTIEAMADWVADALGGAGATSAAVVGHSMGSLVALALAARHPAMVARLVLIGTALQMKVGPELLAAADRDSPDAYAMVNLWGHGPRAGLGGSETPGFWMAGAGQRLLAQSGPGVLARDLRACDEFRGEAVAGQIDRPVLILQGTRDLMTPLKGARALAALIAGAQVEAFDSAGHMLMVEEGGRVLSALAANIAVPHPTVRTATQPVGAPP